MANENIKIVVQEHDTTRPKGSGVSSDIVYVPGFATSMCPPENCNRPILCNSVDEFKSYFGNIPYQFAKDQSYQDVKVVAGAYDKSYIYAEELLNAGLSVLYEAVVQESTDSNKSLVYSFNVTGKGIKRDSIGNVFSNTAGTDDAEVSFYLGDIPTDITRVQVFFIPEENSSDTLEITLKNLSDATSTDATSITSANRKFTTSVVVPEGSDAVCSYVIDWTGKSATNLEKMNELCTFKFATKGTGRFKIHVIASMNIDSDKEFITMTALTATDNSSTILGDFYGALPNRLANLEDKNEYTVKYLTTGAYPSFVKSTDNNYPIATKMLTVACNRNDVIAIIDHTDNPSRALGLTDTGSIYQDVNTFFKNAANTEFGTMFTPWGDYSCSTVSSYDLAATTQAMPASFGYLMCLAKAIKTSPNWLAMAGVTRGIVPNLLNLRTSKVLSNVIAENYQPKYGDVGGNNVISINAITNVKPYGLTIWGNRTLKRVDAKGTVATNFLNTRNMISDIKKLAYNTAKSLMFEQESDALWLSFKSGVSPLLDQLKSGNGISDYKLIKNTTKYNGSALTRGEMSAVIKIFPLYAVEYFEITVVVADNDVAVS